MSPFPSNEMVPVTPLYPLVLASSGRYFAGSVDCATTMALMSTRVAS